MIFKDLIWVLYIVGYVIGLLTLHAHLNECAALSRKLGRDSVITNSIVIWESDMEAVRNLMFSNLS